MAKSSVNKVKPGGDIELKEKVVAINRVVKTTKGGRTFSFSAIVVKVPVMHGTIPHDQLAKEGAAKVLIKPAAHGTGVIAGGSMRAVLESAGVTDVLAKSLGSANPHNVVKATIKALTSIREPIQVARNRNIKLSKVFNG
jgi:small subunit ribosomal protein S5